jgi:hypothetical protein
MPGIGGLVKRRVPDVYFQRYKDGGGVNNRRGKTLSDEEINYIASNSMGMISNEEGFALTYPEIRSSVFGNDNNIKDLSDIEDVNQLEKLYRSFSKENLSRADLGKIHNRTLSLLSQVETPYFKQEYDLNKDLFKFDSNEEYIDDYITKMYPEYTGDREGIKSLIRKSNNSGGYGNDEYNKIYDTLKSYRGEENLRLEDEYIDNEFPILEEAMQEKLRKKQLQFAGPDNQTGEIDRVESMIPNLISRTDETGELVEFIRNMYPNMGDHQIEELMKNIPELRKKEVMSNLEKDFMLHGGPLVNPGTGKVDYFNEEGKFNQGGSVYSNPYFQEAGDPGPYQDSLPFGELETQEEKIRRMDQELIRMLNEDDAAMSEMFDDIDERTQSKSIPDRDVYGEGSDTTYGDDTFARQLYEMEQRKKMQEILDSLEPGEGLAHGGAVRPRGYNMGGAVMPQQQQRPPQGIATMMSDPRTNMGNMPNQQQQQLAALQTTANAANLNANNLQKSMQAQQQQAMQGGVTAPISQVRIPSIKRRQFEDTLLNSRRRGQKAGQMAQRRASIPATIFG